MAINGPYAVDSATLFPHGLALVGEITRSLEYDPDRPREDWRHDRDRDTGLPLWECTMLDLDPEAFEKTFIVRIAADVRPVAPAVASGSPLQAVQLQGLQVTVRKKVTGQDWRTKQPKVSIVYYATATGILPVKQAAADGAKAP